MRHDLGNGFTAMSLADYVAFTLRRLPALRDPRPTDRPPRPGPIETYEDYARAVLK